MNEQPNQTPQSDKQPNNEKIVVVANQTSRFISRWGGPFLSMISYGIILGLGLTGIGLMIISAMISMFFDAGSSSGFTFLTGGIFLTAGCSMILWKLTRALRLLYQMRKQTHAA